MQTAAVKTYNDLELALMVLLGYYGNGAVRAAKLGDRYSSVQTLVQRILDTQTIPSGTGYMNKESIRKAVQAVFNSQISEITEDIINEIV